MVRSGRWLLFFCLLALVISAGNLHAASPEEDAFAIAVDKFTTFPDLAEKDFVDFVQKYPNSIHIPAAILYEARAMLHFRQADAAINLLLTNQARAGKLTSDYLYWLGQAYLQKKDYQHAVDTFAELVQKYPHESTWSLDAVIREAEAFIGMDQPQRVVELLEQTNGLFQENVRAHVASVTMVSGYLLLGDAYLALGNHNGVNSALSALDKQHLDSDSKWQRDYLASRNERAEGRLDDALHSSAGLLETANATNRAEGVNFQAGVLEQSGNLDAAINAYTNNLNADVPDGQQRRAVLKIAELDLKQSQPKLPDVVRRLSNYLEQFPNPKAADLAVLTLGEVRLKQALAGSDTNLTGGETNLFGKALEQFDYLLNTYTNSPLLGKALLDKGWCLWSQGDVTNSQLAFRAAAERLQYSEDQAEARFKWADTQFEMHDYSGAFTNYNYIAGQYTSLPQVNERPLIEQALYQSMQAALAETNPVAAETAVENILKWFPNGFAGPNALLLTGQGLADQNNPAGARKLFAEFEQLYPTNALLLPDIRLAIARSYEKESNWEAAITNYTEWTNAFPKNSLLPRAKFSLAWDTFMAGNETNALTLFTNFISQFPTNELAARAQYWVGDFYYRQKDYLNAEQNYQLVLLYTNSLSDDMSRLRAEARMAAGRSAMFRENYKQAIPYFNTLMSRDYPLDLQVEATMAYADATISGDWTNKPTALKDAIGSLGTITNVQPGTWQAAQALGRIGDCYREWASKDPSQYVYASNAYRAVLEAPYARSEAKDEARYKLGDVIEKQAALKNGDEQTAMVKAALAQYVDAFYQGLHDSEGASPFWTQKSGQAAAELAESLQEWQSVFCVNSKLKTLLPVLASQCDKKMDKAREHGAKPEQCAP